jgi:hypothetical protein
LIDVGVELMIEQPENEAARMALKRFDPIGHEESVAYFKKALEFLQEERPKEALTCLRRASTAERCFPDMFFVTAVALVKLGNLTAASQECRREIQSYPGHDHTEVDGLLKYIEGQLV